MTWIDYAILIVYALGITLAGGLFAGQQKSLKEFFLADRNIPWWAAAFSGIATIVSAISYLGAPGQAFRADLTFLQYRLVVPLVLVIICVVFIPFFHRLELFTAYEYLERRFDLKTRLFASVLFLLFKCAYLGIGIYAPALVIAGMTDIPFSVLVLASGLITTIYTMMGGMRAVIWTDAIQLVVLVDRLVRHRLGDRRAHRRRLGDGDERRFRCRQAALLRLLVQPRKRADAVGEPARRHRPAAQSVRRRSGGNPALPHHIVRAQESVRRSLRP